MDYEVKNNVCKLVENEIEKISKMPSLNDAALGNLYKLVEIEKGLLKIDKLKMDLGSEERGNSYGWRTDNSTNYIPDRYYQGNAYTGDVHYHLEAALRDAKTESERNAIRQAMSNMYK
jgi:hypothetical protein